MPFSLRGVIVFLRDIRINCDFQVVMNLRKKQMFKVEVIHKKLRNTRGVKRENKVRKKLKNVDDIAVLLHRVYASNDSVYEAAEDLVTSRRKYHEIKTKLRSVIYEKNQIREDVRMKKENLQKITSELRKAVDELQTVDTRKLNEHKAAVVQLNSWLVEEDVIEAWKHIGFAEKDLNEDTCDMNGSEDDVRTLNSVSVPNVVESGIVSLNGTVNINRNKCCICLERRINAVLYKCGHICTCFDCALALNSSQEKKCPVCRSDIIDVIRTYLV